MRCSQSRRRRDQGAKPLTDKPETVQTNRATSAFGDAFTGAAEWHINSDEADAFDYNADFGKPADIFDATSPIRISDHDPMLMGLDLTINFARFSDDTFTGPREAGSRLFTTVEGGATVGDAIDILTETTLLSLVPQTIDVDDLTVRADGPTFSASFTLFGPAAAFTLAGTASMGVTGNFLANAITGNAGANAIAAGAGSDTLDGGRARTL
jgi:hypothetical protein